MNQLLLVLLWPTINAECTSISSSLPSTSKEEGTSLFSCLAQSVTKQFRNRTLRKREERNRSYWDQHHGEPLILLTQKALLSHTLYDHPTLGLYEKMNAGEKHVIKTTQRKTTISEREDGPAKSRGNGHSTSRPNREDLLEFYFRMQDKRDDIFTLPCPNSLRRDIEVLQRFIKMHEPPGDVVHEEVVIETEITKVEKKNNH